MIGWLSLNAEQRKNNKGKDRAISAYVISNIAFALCTVDSDFWFKDELVV